jgi:peptide/nickel transport system substrate-binding protein
MILTLPVNHEQLKKVKTDGKHTIVIVLDEGYANMPYIMSDYRSVVVPKATADFDKGIGTGGYILDNLEPGVRAFAKCNPNYWKPGRAHSDEVETTGIEDTVARTNAVRTGNIHVMNRCDRKTSHLLARRPGVQVIETTKKL